MLMETHPTFRLRTHRGNDIMSAMSEITPPPNSAQPLIAVFSTNNETEAHIVAARLRSFDVPAIVQREAAASAIGISVGKLGECHVLVRQPDYQQALALLDDVDQPADELPEDSTYIRYFVDENEAHGEED